jgi:hypothetical protein
MKVLGRGKRVRCDFHSATSIIFSFFVVAPLPISTTSTTQLLNSTRLTCCLIRTPAPPSAIERMCTSNRLLFSGPTSSCYSNQALFSKLVNETLAKTLTNCCSHLNILNKARVPSNVTFFSSSSCSSCSRKLYRPHRICPQRRLLFPPSC